MPVCVCVCVCVCENILLIGIAGHVRICDFGLSAMIEDADAMLRTQVGTLHYQAPELLTGHR